MRTRALVVAVALVAPTVGLGVAGAAPAGAVTGSFAATCVTQSGGIIVATTHPTIAYEVHAPDSVAPGAQIQVPVSFDRAVPANAQVGGAIFDVTASSTNSVLMDVPPGSDPIAGTITVPANGGAGSTVEIRLQRLVAFSELGGSAVGEICTADHTLVVARVGVGVPLVSIGDATVVEGSSGTRAIVFPVTLSRPASSEVMVGYTSESGTATAESDFVSLTGSVVIRAGAVSGVAAFRVRGDAEPEAKEIFRVRLHDPFHAALGRSVGTGRIIDDDPQSGVRLSVGDGSVVEGARGTRSVRFTMSLSSPVAQPVSFHLSTSDGTAIAGTDYRSAELDGVIAPGLSSVTWSVPVIPNATADGNRSLAVHVSAVTGAATGRANGVGTIIDDD